MATRKGAKKRLRLQTSEGVDVGDSTTGSYQSHLKRPTRSETEDSASSAVAGMDYTFTETNIMITKTANLRNG